LPAEQGGYDDRRVYKLDLLERSIEECASRLEKYLHYASVCSGKALDSARADHKDANRERQVQQALPAAWKRLLDEPDDQLLELLAAKVEDLCGYKPDLETCSRFVQGALYAPVSSPSFKDVPAAPRTRTKVGFTLRGQFFLCASAREVMTRLLQELDRVDPSFLDRFAARKHGRKRRYIAKNKLELYRDRPDLCEEYSLALRDGWFVGTNYNKATIESIITLACEVAGLARDSDIIIDLGD
jgi:hypothetical protein